MTYAGTKYNIRFPIGDWSDDGHGKCDYFMVTSNMSVESLREVHFKAPEVVGFDIGSMCSDYESSTLDNDIVEKLMAIGIDPHEYSLNEDTGEWDVLLETDCWMDAEKLVDIWIDVLKYIHAGLELDRVKKPDYEDINFYGSDEKQRHLQTPGYGVFYG